MTAQFESCPLSYRIREVKSVDTEFMDPYSAWNVYFGFGKSDESTMPIIEFQSRTNNLSQFPYGQHEPIASLGSIFLSKNKLKPILKSVF